MTKHRGHRPPPSDDGHWAYVQRLGGKIFRALLHVLAFYIFYRVHPWVESWMTALVDGDLFFLNAVHGATRLAFLGIYIWLLWDMVKCFWRD